MPQEPRRVDGRPSFLRVEAAADTVVARHYRGERFLDAAGALVGVVVLALPALAVAIAIKTTSRGPVLFRQQRVGRDGRSFSMLKFRTMRVGTHEEIRAHDSTLRAYVEGGFKLPPGDPRITSVGRWLRKLSVDEIPQLLNVLRGDMSLVGIRPVERIEFDSRAAADRDCYVQLRPGLTGLWQIDGRSSLSLGERSDLDRWYAANRSASLDLRILWRTPFAVLRINHTH